MPPPIFPPMSSWPRSADKPWTKSPYFPHPSTPTTRRSGKGRREEEENVFVCQHQCVNGPAGGDSACAATASSSPRQSSKVRFALCHCPRKTTVFPATANRRTATTTTSSTQPGPRTRKPCIRHSPARTYVSDNSPPIQTHNPQNPKTRKTEIFLGGSDSDHCTHNP